MEVTFALGIAVFCLLTLFSLLSLGTLTNNISSNETYASNTLSTVIADLRACPSTEGSSDAVTSTLGIVIPRDPQTAASTTLYLDEEGNPGADPSHRSRYRLDIRFIPNEAGSRAASLAMVQISWPPLSVKPDGTVETFLALDRN